MQHTMEIALGPFNVDCSKRMLGHVSHFQISGWQRYAFIFLSQKKNVAVLRIVMQVLITSALAIIYVSLIAIHFIS